MTKNNVPAIPFTPYDDWVVIESVPDERKATTIMLPEDMKKQKKDIYYVDIVVAFGPDVPEKYQKLLEKRIILQQVHPGLNASVDNPYIPVPYGKRMLAMIKPHNIVGEWTDQYPGKLTVQ